MHVQNFNKQNLLFINNIGHRKKLFLKYLNIDASIYYNIVFKGIVVNE